MPFNLTQSSPLNLAALLQALDHCLLLQVSDRAYVDHGLRIPLRPPLCTLCQWNCSRLSAPCRKHSLLSAPIAGLLVSHPLFLLPSCAIFSRDEKPFRPVLTLHGDIEHCFFLLTLSAPTLCPPPRLLRTRCSPRPPPGI